MKPVMHSVSIAVRYAVLVVLYGASAQAQTLQVSPGTIPVNQPSLVELTLTDGPEVFGIVDATIQGGVIQVVGGTFMPPNPRLLAVITASGSPSPATIAVTVETLRGPEVWSGAITVQGPPQNPPALTVVDPPGITAGGTIAVGAPSFPMAGFLQPFTGSEAYRVSVINATTGAESPGVVVPNPGANRADWTATVAVAAGNNAMFVFAHDDNCPGCTGTLLPFTASFGPAGNGLAFTVPNYINPGAVMGPCQGEPVNPVTPGFGVGPTGGGCCGGPGGGGGPKDGKRDPFDDKKDSMGENVNVVTGRFGADGDASDAGTCGADDSGGGGDPSGESKGGKKGNGGGDGTGGGDGGGFLTMPTRGIDIDFSLTYNAHYEFPGGFVLGNGGWSHTCAIGLFPGPAGSLTWVNGRTARVKPFTRVGDFWQADGTPGLIRQNTDGSYTLRWASGAKEHYHAIDGTPMSGLITGMVDANIQANRVSIAYETGLAGEMRVASVTDTYGRVALSFHYDDGSAFAARASSGGGAAAASTGSGRLTSVTDFTGRELSFTYTSEGLLETVRSPITAAFPAGKTYKYGYHDGLVNAITYPNEVAAGIDAPRVQVVYEPVTLRVLSQTIGGTNASGVAAGGTITFEYLTRPGGAPYTRVTDRRGFVTEYDFTPEGRISVRTVYDPLRPNGPLVTSYSYSPDGFISRIVFPEGNETRWIYDTTHSRFQIANVLEEIHLPGPRGGAQAEIRIVKTYEPLFNQVRTITDPRGTDPFYVPPFGASGTAGRYTTRLYYGYQEMTAFPAVEAGWGMVAGDVEINLGDLNGNGVLGDG